MTAYFRANHTGEEDDPWDFVDAAPEIPCPLPLTDTNTEEGDTKSVSSVQSAPPATRVPIGEGAKSKGVSCHKPTLVTKKDELEDLCESKEAIRMYPKSSNTVKETGIPMDLQVHREHATTHACASIYLCRHEKCMGSAYFTQNPASLYSDMRRKHLQIVLACPYCQDKIYWNSHGWKDHMTSHHRNVPHYGHMLVDEAREAHQMFSTPKQEAEAQMDVPYNPPAKTEASEDSSSDSSTSSSSEEGEPIHHLTSAQKQHIKEGAYAVRNPTTSEALEKHKSAFKQPTPHSVAARNLTVNPPATQLLAETIVLADLPPQKEVDPLADMPELEEFPPQPLTKKRARTDDE